MSSRIVAALMQLDSGDIALRATHSGGCLSGNPRTSAGPGVSDPVGAELHIVRGQVESVQLGILPCEPRDISE